MFSLIVCRAYFVSAVTKQPTAAIARREKKHTERLIHMIITYTRECNLYRSDERPPPHTSKVCVYLPPIGGRRLLHGRGATRIMVLAVFVLCVVVRRQRSASVSLGGFTLRASHINNS